MTKQYLRMFMALYLAIAMLVTGCSSTLDPEAALAKSQAEREKRNFQSAAIILKSVLQKEPDHAEARYVLGLIHADVGDYKSAEGELRRARELKFDPARVIPAHGKALLMIGSFKEVLDQARVEAQFTDRVQAEILALRGHALMGLGRRGEAAESFNQSLVKQPELSDALVGQARLAAAERKLDDAWRLIERAIAAAPKNVEAWLVKGDMARLRGDNETAATAYKAVMEIDPNSIVGGLNSARMHIVAGRFEEARKLIAQIRKRAPRLPKALYMQGMLEYQQKNYPAAREAVQQVLKVTPDDLEGLLLAGMVEYVLGSYVTAQTYLARVVEGAPGFLHARKVLITSLASSGQVSRAIQEMENALRVAPEDSQLLTMAGELYMQSNEFAKARSYLERATRLDPESSDTRTQLGINYIGSRDTERGLAELEAASKLDPAKHRADLILVLTHLQNSDYARAIKAVQILESKQPNNPQTHNLKGAVYLHMKDMANARKAYARALELRPGFVTAASNLAQLDLAEKNPKAARMRLEEIIAKEKDNVQAIVALVTLMPQLGGSLKEQVELLERARKSNPRTVQPLLMLARTYSYIGDRKSALEVAQQAYAAAEDNPDVLEVLGTAQLGAGQKQQGLTTMSKLASLRPKFPMALVHLARAQMVNGKLGEATITLKKALSISPELVETQLALWEVEMLAGRFPGAHAIARQIQKQYPKSPHGYDLEGSSLLAEKKFGLAASAYEKAIALDRQTGFAIKLHRALVGAGKVQEAEKQLTKALVEFPEDMFIRRYAGFVYLQSNRVKQAVEQYEWLQAKLPNSAEIFNNLAIAYQKARDSRALATAERAFKLNPESAVVSDTLGWILIEQGNTQRGIERLQDAVKLDPGNREARFHLAQAWVKAGDVAKARIELKQLLSGDAKFPERTAAEKLAEQLGK